MLRGSTRANMRHLRGSAAAFNLFARLRVGTVSRVAVAFPPVEAADEFANLETEHEKFHSGLC